MHQEEKGLCSSDGNIRAIFLPPNTTTVLQLTDSGILESTKCQYSKLLPQRVLAENEGEIAPSLLEVIS